MKNSKAFPETGRLSFFNSQLNVHKLLCERVNQEIKIHNFA
jgi:hypothetical protein